jgi:hypothetical protein
MAGSHKTTCPLCRSRKGRRACPAKGEAICPHCCGSKRRVEIHCPEDCAYLDGAHAGAWEGRETEKKRDLRRVALHAQGLTREQAELFFLALLGVSGLRGRRSDLDDALLLEAASALRKTTETRRSGIVYEHAPADPRARGLVVELREMFEARAKDGTTTAPDDGDLLAVLRALEGGLAATLQERGGPTDFLDSAARLSGRPPGHPGSSGPLLVAP